MKRVTMRKAIMPILTAVVTSTSVLFSGGQVISGHENDTASAKFTESIVKDGIDDTGTEPKTKIETSSTNKEAITRFTEFEKQRAQKYMPLSRTVIEEYTRQLQIERMKEQVEIERKEREAERARLIAEEQEAARLAEEEAERIRAEEEAEAQRQAELEAQANAPVPGLNHSPFQPMGLNAEQFNRALAGTGLAGQGQAFADLEATHGVNGLFALSVAIQESGGGTSNLAVSRNNCFGMKGRSGNWMSFGSKYENIMYFGDMVNRLYTGLSLDAFAAKYCPPTAQDWKSKVLSIMGQRYAKI